MKTISFSGLERTMELKILRMSFFQFMGIELNLKGRPQNPLYRPNLVLLK